MSSGDEGYSGFKILKESFDAGSWLAIEIMAIKHEALRQVLLDSRKSMQEVALLSNDEIIAKYENDQE